MGQICNVNPPAEEAWVEVPVNIDTSKIVFPLSIKAYKRNGIVVVDMQGITFAEIGDAQMAGIYGLPKAVCQSNFLLSSVDAASIAQQIGNVVWINAGGTAINFHIKDNTYRCWGTLIYPTDE